MSDVTLNPGVCYVINGNDECHQSYRDILDDDGNARPFEVVMCFLSDHECAGCGGTPGDWMDVGVAHWPDPAIIEPTLRDMDWHQSSNGSWFCGDCQPEEPETDE